MVHFKDRLLKHLKEEEVDKFGEYAFGPKYKEMYVMEMHLCWNLAHGGKLQLKDLGIADDEIPKMIKLWRKESESK